MPGNSFDGIFYVKAAPTIRYEDGLFFVCYDVGKVHAEFVMHPRHFLKAMAVAQTAVNTFHEEKERGGHNIHPMGNRRA